MFVADVLSFLVLLFVFLSMICFFFCQRYGDHRDLHRVERRQRQRCIRDSLADLRRIAEFFPTPGYEYQLDPAYEPEHASACLLYTSPSPRDRTRSCMPSSACKKQECGETRILSSSFKS